MTRSEELKEKHARVSEYMDGHHLDAVLLTRRDNFSWFTGGRDNHVVTSGEEGVATLLITPKEVTVITNNIEAPRIFGEELTKKEAKCKFKPWHDSAAAASLLKSLIGKKRVASDNAIGRTKLLKPDFAELRYSLTHSEIKRYRSLGADASAAIEAAAKAVKPGMTEFQIAALLSQQVISRGMEPAVILIATDERIKKYRHPIPTGRKVKRCVEMVLCARRNGLVISCTRFVHFGPLPKIIERKHRAVCLVDAAMNLSSTVGTCVADVFRVARKMYRKTGFANEWKLHHQGGPTGYGPREYLATPTDERCILPNQALAWNPSITGTKSEDTILSTPRGVQFLSGPQKWPTISVEYNGITLDRPDILVR